MQPRSAKLLEDIRDSAAFIQEAVEGKTLAEYSTDRLLRRAIERSFEIVGEALNRLTKLDPETVGKIEHSAQIIGFRNALIHGYDLIDEERVWETITKDIPPLIDQVGRLLRG